ncbi:hypothetical protein [Marinomonas transparens]|uniref:Peptidoglycan-binding protein CsiV n=1 Tax=Marinomonas transparens TaxID=2795388 RepID=A0A934JRT2_9GAMM|nr:hypothetical protein [Marinomonas transparens]MBJ7538859.1 hypothetical protein [Marinomonas transparens]
MKKHLVILLSLTILTSRAFAVDDPIDPDTARAYEGYLLTFIWPEDKSSEHIDYQDVLNLTDLIRLPPKTIEDDTSTGADIAAISVPFDGFKEALDKQVQVLSNQKWTLIFKHPGDMISKTFHSEQEKDGYPELTGKIDIKLGRYLESDIRYQYYLFDSFTLPNIPDTPTTDLNSPDAAIQEKQFKQFEPALVLELEQKNKTASKKVNYLDHPTIGTLLYFEPIDLEDAIEQIALQSLDAETGQSLNYDDLQSTNELTPFLPLIETDTPLP